MNVTNIILLRDTDDGQFYIGYITEFTKINSQFSKNKEDVVFKKLGNRDPGVFDLWQISPSFIDLNMLTSEQKFNDYILKIKFTSNVNYSLVRTIISYINSLGIVASIGSVTAGAPIAP